jgi:hypothetical protein
MDGQRHYSSCGNTSPLLAMDYDVDLLAGANQEVILPILILVFGGLDPGGVGTFHHHKAGGALRVHAAGRRRFPSFLARRIGWPAT